MQLDLQLVRLALNDGDIDRARRLLGSVLARDPDNIEALVDLGDALYQGGDLEGAIGRYRRATKLGPRSYRNFYKLATLLKAKGDGLRANGPATAAIGPYQQAEAAFRRAVEIFPGDHFSMTNLAGLLLDWVPSPREKEAEAWYLRATRCGPRFPQAHLGLGYVRLRRGHPAQAVAPLETAVALREEPTSVFLLGEAYRLLGRGEEAAQCYRRVLELDPGHAQARRRLREEARGAGRTGG